MNTAAVGWAALFATIATGVVVLCWMYPWIIAAGFFAFVFMIFYDKMA